MECIWSVHFRSIHEPFDTEKVAAPPGPIIWLVLGNAKELGTGGRISARNDLQTRSERIGSVARYAASEDAGSYRRRTWRLSSGRKGIGPRPNAKLPAVAMNLPAAANAPDPAACIRSPSPGRSASIGFTPTTMRGGSAITCWVEDSARRGCTATCGKEPDTCINVDNSLRASESVRPRVKPIHTNLDQFPWSDFTGPVRRESV